MKTGLVFISTLDGKVTKWGEANVSIWSSPEDQKYFKKYGMIPNLLFLGAIHY